MSSFYANKRFVLLAIGVILVAGLSSYSLLPRMEDPEMRQRVALVNTIFPGADADRVESLVTDRLEKKLREVEEIKELRSFSRTGISTITIELRDEILDVDTVWSRVRDKLSDVVPQLPPGASNPEFDEINIKAYALLVALTWQPAGEPNYAILRRLAEDVEDSLRNVAGTEEVDTFGDPKEEILVELKPELVASLNQTTQDIANQIRSSDSKVTAGLLRGSREQYLLEVRGELDSLERIATIPIRHNEEGNFVPLSEVATIKKGIVEPPDSLAFIDGKPGIVLGVLVRSSIRLDHWNDKVQTVLEKFSRSFPEQVRLEQIFEQNIYVQQRLENLLFNLLVGALAVMGVIFVLMGWRNSLIVGSALPLAALMVLSGMRFLGLPMHQMSVTGLIIALGLLIDNAIVIVDEVSVRIRAGMAPVASAVDAVQHLAIPLVGSTLTTAFAFAPIALMPGPAGEFVGSIAVSVILAIFSSLLLALTITPAITAMFSEKKLGTEKPGWWRVGISIPWLTRMYHQSLLFIYRRPIFGIALTLVFPVTGFVLAPQLPEQFFPAADRDQFQIEMELPAQYSLRENIQIIKEMRKKILLCQGVKQVHWFLGESAPSFYYNLVAKRRGSSYYAQAMVQIQETKGARNLIHRLQKDLDRDFPQARILVRQLEQGPPFDAPIEVRLFGPDLAVLEKLGEKARGLLASIPHVTHTRSELSETLPKLFLEVDEEETRLLGLDHTAIAHQLSTILEGAVGGSILEETEELPVRVRVPNKIRGDLSSISSLELQPSPGKSGNGHPGIPISAVAKLKISPETSSIPRLDGRRLNEVQAHIQAGVLPSTVLDQFKKMVARGELHLPPGYYLEYGGEAAERDTAVGNLMANTSILLILMAATLVLSFSSFRLAGLIGLIGIFSAGLGLGSLWLFGYPFGFMAIVGTMGLIGVAINDSIVVLAALRENTKASAGDPEGIAEVVIHCSRHVIATTLTTMVGFLPLILGGGGFWPPLAVTIAGGVGGATLLAIYFVPSAYLLLMGYAFQKKEVMALEPIPRTQKHLDLQGAELFPT